MSPNQKLVWGGGGIPSWELRVCKMGGTEFAPPLMAQTACKHPATPPERTPRASDARGAPRPRAGGGEHPAPASLPSPASENPSETSTSSLRIAPGVFWRFVRCFGSRMTKSPRLGGPIATLALLGRGDQRENGRNFLRWLAQKSAGGGGPRSPTSGMGDCGFRPPLMPHATPSRGHEGGCRAAARPPHARLPPHGPLMVHEGLDYA